jgi:hypothetical protein
MRVTHLVVVVLAAGCTDEPTQPDISDPTIAMHWTTGHQRTIDVSIVADIPCSGTKQELLGEEGIECVSAPWTLTIDGVAVETTPVTCTSAHDAFLAGPQPKRCEGGKATSAPLPEAVGEDVVIVLATDQAEHRVTLHGVRRTYTWTEQAPLQSSSEPGLVRVDDVELRGTMFKASFTPPDGGAPTFGIAETSTTDTGQLKLSFASADRVAGLYAVRVDGYAHDDGATIAVPIEGTLNVE